MDHLQGLNRGVIVLGVGALFALAHALDASDMIAFGWGGSTATEISDRWRGWEPSVTPVGWASNNVNSPTGCQVQYSWSAREDKITDELYAMGFLFNIVAQPNTTGSFSLNVYQSKQYWNGELIEVPGGTRLIYAKTIPYSTTQSNAQNIAADWLSNIQAKDSTWKTGQYIVRLDPKAGGLCGAQKNFTFQLKKYNDQGFETPPGGGGAGGPPSEGANGTAAEQESFWGAIFADLFIPSEASTDALKDAVAQFSTWGPFGIYTAVTSSFEEHAGETGRIDDDYVILVLGQPMDLAPYEFYIRLFRALIAGGMWFIIIMGLWKTVQKRF